MHTVDFSRLDLAPGARLLDIGCGEGRHTLGAYVHAGADTIGVDLRMADLSTARARAGAFAPDAGTGEPDRILAFAVADAARLPFPAASFACVILSEVLEHLPRYETTLAEAARVLQPGGTLAVSVPRFMPEWICWRLCSAYHRVPGGHLRIFRERALVREIEEHGFRLRGRHWAHALHSPYWWLSCLRWQQRERSRLVAAYHRFLVWDLLSRPALTRGIERALNPIIGKSLVLYLERLR